MTQSPKLYAEVLKSKNVEWQQKGKSLSMYEGIKRGLLFSNNYTLSDNYFSGKHNLFTLLKLPPKTL